MVAVCHNDIRRKGKGPLVEIIGQDADGQEKVSDEEPF